MLYRYLDQLGLTTAGLRRPGCKLLGYRFSKYFSAGFQVCGLLPLPYDDAAQSE